MAASQLLRIDESLRPTMFRCARVSRAELEQLRKIRHVVRLGRVLRIDKGQIVLEHGSLPSDPDWLYIDGTGDGIKSRPAPPLFDGDTITPQRVGFCQADFSAAFMLNGLGRSL